MCRQWETGAGKLICLDNQRFLQAEDFAVERRRDEQLVSSDWKRGSIQFGHTWIVGGALRLSVLLARLLPVDRTVITDDCLLTDVDLSKRGQLLRRKQDRAAMDILKPPAGLRRCFARNRCWILRRQKIVALVCIRNQPQLL